MKTLLKKITLIIPVLFIIACSNETDDKQNDISISHFIRKNYNIYATSNTLIDSSYHVIVNNKMQGSTFTNLATLQQSRVIYNYENNKISEVSNYTNNNLTSKTKYIYNNNKLTEFRTDVYNNNQITNISKNTFTHTQDTVFSQFTRSNDGGQTFTLINDSKIILDQNKNRTYLEQFDYLNNEKKRVVYSYDGNSNIIREEVFIVLQNGVDMSVLVNTTTYNSNLNTLYYINVNTFQKETLMLLHHLGTGNVSNVNVKSYSPNVIETYQTNFTSDLTFELANSFNQNNYSINSSFKSYLSNSLISRFEYEYYFN